MRDLPEQFAAQHCVAVDQLQSAAISCNGHNNQSWYQIKGVAHRKLIELQSSTCVQYASICSMPSLIRAGYPVTSNSFGMSHIA